MASTNFSSIDWDAVSARVAEQAHVWREILRSTTPLDRVAVTEAINDLYQTIDKPAPLIVWCQSPWQAIAMRGTLEFAVPREVTDGTTSSEMTSQNVRPEMRNFLRPASDFKALWERMWSQIDSQIPAERTQNLTKGDSDSQRAKKGTNDWVKMIPIPFVPDFDAFESFLPNGVRADSRIRDMCHALRKEISAVCQLRLKEESKYADLEREYRDSLAARTEGVTNRQIQTDVQRVTMQAMSLTQSTRRRETSTSTSPWIFRFGIEALKGNMQQELDKIWGAEDRRIFNFIVSASTAIMTTDFDRGAATLFPFYDCFVQQISDLPLGPKNRKRLSLFLALAKHSQFYVFLDKAVFLSERPKIYEDDGQGRLHSETGPAIEFEDGYKVYSWHGATVPQSLIEHPEKLTVQEILAELNIEVRRIMIERFGPSRFVEESGAEKIHEDECGVLFRKVLVNDEPLVMVKVLNTTAEPDGSYKTYFLRVPPTMRTAREAVAWTFERTPEDYSPTVES